VLAAPCGSGCVNRPEASKDLPEIIVLPCFDDSDFGALQTIIVNWGFDSQLE